MYQQILKILTLRKYGDSELGQFFFLNSTSSTIVKKSIKKHATNSVQ